MIFLEKGLSIKLAIENFSVIDDAIKKNQIKNSILKNIFRDIFSIKKISNTDYYINIKDNELGEKIFKTISDFESFTIIKFLMDNNSTIDNIIRSTKIPKTSAYRKIHRMILDGFLIINSRGKTKTRFSTNITCLFKRILFEVKQNQIKITLVVPEKTYKNSSIIDFI